MCLWHFSCSSTGDQGRESSSSFFSRSSQDKEIKHPLHTIKSGDEEEKYDQLPSTATHLHHDDSLSVYTDSTYYSTTASLHSINGKKKKKKKKKRKPRIVQQGNHITCIRPGGDRKSSVSRSIENLEISPFNDYTDPSPNGPDPNNIVADTPPLSQHNLEQHNQISFVLHLESLRSKKLLIQFVAVHPPFWFHSWWFRLSFTLIIVCLF